MAGFELQTWLYQIYFVYLYSRTIWILPYSKLHFRPVSKGFLRSVSNQFDRALFKLLSMVQSNTVLYIFSTDWNYGLPYIRWYTVPLI